MNTTTLPSPSSPPSPDNAPWPSTQAARLGYAGLVPFVGGAILVWLVRPDAHPFVIDALAKYAALIVSFLGGIHWTIGMRAPDGAPARFTWSVVPSLVAWVAVVMPPYAGLVVLGAMLVVCYLVDRKSYPLHGLAHWLTLRFRLTVVGALSCFLGAAGS